MKRIAAILVLSAGIEVLVCSTVCADDLLTDLQHLRKFARQCAAGDRGSEKIVSARFVENAPRHVSKRRQIGTLVRETAVKHGVDPTLALAVAYVESRLNQGAVSHKGARGVMQIMPATGKELGIDCHDLEENIEGGVRYLQQQISEFGLERGLAAYNFGPDNVRQGRRWPAETRHYVKKVLALYNRAPKQN